MFEARQVINDLENRVTALEAAPLPLDTGNVAANQADSTAVDVAGIVSDFNDLLDKLKAAGLMEADA